MIICMILSTIIIITFIAYYFELSFKSSCQHNSCILFSTTLFFFIAGIFDQLQSLKVRRILKLLDRSKSTYNGPFAKLCKEVFHARSEANNIFKYLRPLVPYFTALENEVSEEEVV